MVKRCVAAECSNTYSDNVSLYKIPRDPILRQQWAKQVQSTRAQLSGPSEHSQFCVASTSLTAVFNLIRP